MATVRFNYLMPRRHSNRSFKYPDETADCSTFQMFTKFGKKSTLANCMLVKVNWPVDENTSQSSTKIQLKITIMRSLFISLCYSIYSLKFRSDHLDIFCHLLRQIPYFLMKAGNNNWKIGPHDTLRSASKIISI